MTHAHRKNVPLRALVLATLVIMVGTLLAAAVGAQSADDTVNIDQPVDHDVYAANREIFVRANIDGDLVATGQRIVIDGQVTGDIIVAAQDIAIRSAVGDDVRAAGQVVRITAPIAGHVVATGQTVKIEERVGDWAWLSGQFVEVRDKVGGELKIAGKEITLNSEVSGDVEALGDILKLGPEAVVRGNLTWYSENEVNVDPAATVDGSIVKKPLPGSLDDRSKCGGGLMFTLSIIVSVVLLYLVFPNWLSASADRMMRHPFKSLALGFALFVSVPVLAIILIVTTVGTWLGLGVLGAYLLLLLVGVLTGLFAVSDWTLHRFVTQPVRWQAVVAIIATVIVVGLVSSIPWVGFFAVLAVWLLGVGALGLLGGQKYSEQRA